MTLSKEWGCAFCKVRSWQGEELHKAALAMHIILNNMPHHQHRLVSIMARMSHAIESDQHHHLALGCECAWQAAEQHMCTLPPLQPLRAPSPTETSDSSGSPEDTASILSRITFSWMSPLMAHGYKEPLAMEDVYGVPKSDRLEVRAV